MSDLPNNSEEEKMTQTLVPTTPTRKSVDLKGLMLRMESTRLAATALATTSTLKDRKDAWKGHLSVEKRHQLRSVFAQITKKFAKLVPPEPRHLAPKEVDILMEEQEALIAGELAIKGRKESLREAVFGAIDSDLIAAGAEMDVSITPGFLDSPSTGKRFVREGGGRNEPTIDLDILKESLTEQQFAQVVKRTVVPAYTVPEQVTESVDDEAMMAMIDGDPFVMEALRKAIVPGAPKSVRLNIRSIPTE